MGLYLQCTYFPFTFFSLFLAIQGHLLCLDPEWSLSGLVLLEDEPVNFARLGMDWLSDDLHAVLLFLLLYLTSAFCGTWPPVLESS